MALFSGNFYSEALLANVNIKVIIPVPDCDDYTNGDLKNYSEGSKFQTLYLLHGAYGDETDWIRNTKIDMYAQKHRISVVMAPAANSFYLDLPHGGAYSYFFEKELPEFVENIFPLSKKREDRFIAGLSMGGYGALKIALTNPGRYAAVAGLSGAYNIEEIQAELNNQRPGSKNVFSDITEVPEEERKISLIAERALLLGKKLPEIFLTCGKDDYIVRMSREMKEEFEKLNIVFTYEEHSGEHNWEYWDKHIQRVLDWMPLKREYL